MVVELHLMLPFSFDLQQAAIPIWPSWPPSLREAFVSCPPPQPPVG